MNTHAKGQLRITIGVVMSLLMVGSLLAACGGAQVEPTPSGPPPLPSPVLRMIVNPPDPEVFLAIEADTETADVVITETPTEAEGESATAESGADATPDGDALTETPQDESESEATESATSDADVEDEATAEPTAAVVEQPLEIDYPAAEDALERALYAKTGLSVDIEIVARSADALNTLCNLAATDLPTIAWLDGLTYLVATARECGQASLQISRGDAMGQAGQLIIDPRLGTTSLTAIASRTYCRLGYTDLYSWLLPSIALETVNIDLTEDVELVDQPNLAALVDAVVDGDCTMTGIAEGTLDRLGIDPGAVEISLTTPPLPYGVLVFAPEVEQGVRLTMESVLAAMSETPDSAALLWPFLAQDVLLPIVPDDFADLRSFVAESGLNLAQLGE